MIYGFFQKRTFRILVLIFPLLLSAHAKSQERIMGGTEVTLDNAFTVAIKFFSIDDYYFRCAGSLVDSRFVLTTAACVDEVDANQLVVSIGDLTPHDSEGVELPVSEVAIHPDFDLIATKHDIALLKLASETSHPSLQMGAGDLQDGSELIVQGWGRIAEGNIYPKTLLETQVYVLSNHACTELWADNGVDVGEDIICTQVTDQDSCDGDGGGPLMQVLNDGPVQVGIVSFGSSCFGPDRLPSGYTRVSSYLPWITDVIQGVGNEPETRKEKSSLFYSWLLLASLLFFGRARKVGI